MLRKPDWQDGNLRLCMGHPAWARRSCCSRSCPSLAKFSIVRLRRVHKQSFAALAELLVARSDATMLRICQRPRRLPSRQVFRLVEGDRYQVHCVQEDI